MKRIFANSIAHPPRFVMMAGSQLSFNPSLEFLTNRNNEELALRESVITIIKTKI